MLRYTGHPLVDVGIAAILAFREKTNPADITDADLDAVADFIARQYTVPPLKSFLTVAFVNSGFTQPAFESQPEKRQLYADKVARSYASVQPESDERCIFTGDPVSGISWSVDDSLPPGRAFREHIPLLNGRDIINFVPGGEAGVPVSGRALLAIQFFPMGCAKCGGRLLAVHSENPDIMLHFARSFFRENVSNISKAQASGSAKMPEAPHSARTMLITTFLAIESRRRDALADAAPAAVTAYHLSNSGQSQPLDERNPPLSIYYLPLQVTVFLATVSGGEYRQYWQEIAQRAWQRPPPPKRGNDSAEEAFTPRYNRLYEDLFQLAGNERAFVRTYFLRLPYRYATDDLAKNYKFAPEVHLVSWSLVNLFLKEVIRMSDSRLDQIRKLGDRLADYVFDFKDKQFFRHFFHEQNAEWFRLHLIRANLVAIRAGQAPFLTLDPYTQVFHLELFEEGSETFRVDWKFARDLVLIRMIEQLHAKNYFGNNAELIDDMTKENPEDSTEK